MIYELITRANQPSSYQHGHTNKNKQLPGHLSRTKRRRASFSLGSFWMATIHYSILTVSSVGPTT